jgi:hypothetical protein
MIETIFITLLCGYLIFKLERFDSRSDKIELHLAKHDVLIEDILSRIDRINKMS